MAFEGKSFESDLVISEWERTPGGWVAKYGDVSPLVSRERSRIDQERAT